MRSMVQALGSNKQHNSWACPGYSWRACGGQWGDPPLPGVLHTSYNSHTKYSIAYPYMYPYPWTTSPLTISVVQTLSSKNQGNSWVCMCRCVVTLPWPKFHVILLNHPSGTYIKMLHHWISIIGLTWPSTPTIAMRPTDSAKAKS